MREEVIISGFGGQGIIFMGTLLASSAMEQGLEVTVFPSYGAEMRGGTANCGVIISDREIGSPIVTKPHSLIAMNEPSVDRFSTKIKKGGLIVVNSSLVKKDIQRDDIRKVTVSATQVAEETGDVKVSNMVALGAYIKATGIVSLDNAVKSLNKVLGEKKKDLIGINEKALRKGAEK